MLCRKYLRIFGAYALCRSADLLLHPPKVLESRTRVGAADTGAPLILYMGLRLLRCFGSDSI